MSARDLLAVLWLFVPAYVANMTPVLVRGQVEWLAGPIDSGRTWRGLLSGTIAGTLAFAVQRMIHDAGLLRQLQLFDYAASGLLPGVLLSLGALAGDAVKSFFTRQIGIVPGASWIGPDQLDFLVGAYACVAFVYDSPLASTLAIAPIVFIGTLLTTATGHGLGLKPSWI